MFRRKVSLIAPAAILLLFGGAAMSIEQPNYTVVYESDGIEYRQYDSYLVGRVGHDRDCRLFCRRQ